MNGLRTKLLVALVVSLALFGCSEQKAEKEYGLILAKEASGAATKALIDELQGFAAKHPGTKAAASAQQKLTALNDKHATELREASADSDLTKLLEVKLAGSKPREALEALKAFVATHPATKAASRAEERIAALTPKAEAQQKEEVAQAEYAELLKEEQAGGDPKTLTAKYESLVAKFPGTDSATRAAERLASLQSKIKELETARVEFEAEKSRWLDALRAAMLETAKSTALKAHVVANLSGKATATPRSPEKLAPSAEGKSWAVEQEYLVVVGALQSTRELVKVQGTLGYNDFTRKFSTNVVADLVVPPTK